MDLQKLYDSIKYQAKEIADLAVIDDDKSNVESFTDPYDLGGKLETKSPSELLKAAPDNELLQLMVKNDLTFADMLDVYKNFDLSPDELSDGQKINRRKYLELALESIEKNRVVIKLSVQNTSSMFGMVPEIIDKNSDSMINTLIRIVKLLIGELDPPSGVKEKVYMALMIVFIILCLIMSILYAIK